MKVLIVVESFPATSETFVLNHIKGLLDAGVEVRIFAFNGKQGIESPVYEQYELAQRTSLKPILPTGFIKRYSLGIELFLKCFRVYPKQTLNCLNVWTYGMAALKLIPLYELALFATAETFDIVHCHFGPIGEKVADYQLRGILRAPLVVSFHGYDVDSPAIVNHPNFYGHLKRRSDAYIVNSNYTLRKIYALGLDKDKATIIPASFDVSFFRSSPAPDQKDCLRFITVGRLIPVKGIEYAIRAMSVLKNKTQVGFEYLVVGEGPEEEKLKALTQELRLQGTVLFVGKQTPKQVKEQLTSADIFFLTGIRDEDGREEGQGLVVQEAQAMELPVVVSDIGGTSEGLLNGRTGFLVEEKNIDQIVEAAYRLIQDAGLRKRMGREGRRFVEEKYSIEKTTEKILSEYKRILGAAPQ